MAFPGGLRPTDDEWAAKANDSLDELREWGFIGEPEVVDATWVEFAYTWAWPGGTWRADALRELAQHDVHMAGRYGRWKFQGIAESIREGLALGAALGRQP
jgi:hypothetical protein